MWEPPRSGSARGYWLSAHRVLVASLIACVALIVYLLANPDIRALALSPLRSVPANAEAAENTQPVESAPTDSSGAAPAAPGKLPGAGLEAAGSPGTPAVAGSVLTIDLLEAQLDAMQLSLQAVAAQAGVAIPDPPASKGPLPSIPIAPRPWTGEVGDAAYAGAALRDAEMVAAVAEIERLYAIMQPLMLQMKNATELGRSASEQAALRAQMTDLHQQLNELIARVEAEKALQAVGAAGGAAGTIPSVTYQASPVLPATLASTSTDSMNVLLDALFVEMQGLQALSSGAGIRPQTPTARGVESPAPVAAPRAAPALGTLGRDPTASLDQMLALIGGILADMRATPVEATGN